MDLSSLGTDFSESQDWEGWGWGGALAGAEVRRFLLLSVHLSWKEDPGPCQLLLAILLPIMS